MEKITKYFKQDYENDTTIEYVNTGSYSMLNCSFTGEDPDYGTDTLHYTAQPAVSMEQMAYEMLQEVKDFLDYRDGEIEASRSDVQIVYDDYSSSTLIAIESALYKISRDYHPDKMYATIRDASEWIIKEWRKDNKKVFAFCESDREEAKGDPAKHEDQGGWFGIKHILAGLFDNDPCEFIAMVGYYGGGSLALAYADANEADDVTCETELRHAICRATGWDADNMIYIEEEK